MQNDEQKIVDLYIPRKCSATNRLITAKVKIRDELIQKQSTQTLCAPAVSGKKRALDDFGQIN